MIEGACHCRAVKLSVSRPPEFLNQCNCSICRRLGSLWGYYAADEATVTGETATYSWGERSLLFHRCPNCGCTTHWSPASGEARRLGINFRMMAPEVVAGLRIRRFDGADSWRYLD